MAQAAKRSASDRTRKRKITKTVTEGRIYITAKFNNTLIMITDKKGNKLVQASAGSCGFRGSRKSTPFAAQIAAETAAKIAIESYGMNSVVVVVKGPGPGRESSIRALIPLGISIKEVIDGTPIPFNGVRAKKKRRV
ncbi:MAG: 30S ribosomal protein S11 [Pseudomonadota bacterium]